MSYYYYYWVVYNSALTSAVSSLFLKRNINLILAFDLRIFYFVSKSDGNINMSVFQTTVKLCSKIEIIFSSQRKLTSTKNMTESAQKQLRSSYKIRSEGSKYAQQ